MIGGEIDGSLRRVLEELEAAERRARRRARAVTWIVFGGWAILLGCVVLRALQLSGGHL